MPKPYYETNLGKLYCGDCLEIMPQITDKIDLVTADLPYGVTDCQWDSLINLNDLWPLYNQITKNSAIIALTANQPFSSMLIMNNLSMFKYEWIWAKNRATGFLLSKHRPLSNHEHILIFGKGLTKYKPQKTFGHPPTNSAKGCSQGSIYHGKNIRNYSGGDTSRFPLSIQYFKSERGFHPVQKPISLICYILKTYTDENDLVLDNVIGSGTTAVACERLNRRWIGIEISEEYCETAKNRIKKEAAQIKIWETNTHAKTEQDSFLH